jgi:hypothetical protein
VLLILLLSTNLAVLTPTDVTNLSHAIYVTEGANHTRHPYGIMSVRVSSVEEAKQVCERTIVHQFDNWQRSPKTNNFVQFLGDKYCPPADDPVGNRNWKRNVTWIITHTKQEH